MSTHAGPAAVGMDVYEDGGRVATNVLAYDVPDTNQHNWLVRVYGTGPMAYNLVFGGG